MYLQIAAKDISSYQYFYFTMSTSVLRPVSLAGLRKNFPQRLPGSFRKGLLARRGAPDFYSGMSRRIPFAHQPLRS
jgi:hypothetical protein